MFKQFTKCPQIAECQQATYFAVFKHLPPINYVASFSSFIYKPFNHPDLAICTSRFNTSFETSCIIASDPVPSPTPTHAICALCPSSLHWHLNIKELTAGSGIYDTDCICPPFAPDNPNLFATTFGIEFNAGSNCLVRPVSAFEFVSAFGLKKKLLILCPTLQTSPLLIVVSNKHLLLFFLR